MKSDTEIQDDVIDELRWDPQITEPDVIGVAVTDGAVTLTGSVPTYAQRLVAARAAERVYEVKAVANELKVKLAGAPRDDSDIARAIAHVLENNVQVPEGKVHARVEGGWVTLDGEVEWGFQRYEVERMVRQVRGVIGVTDTIVVKPSASPQSVQAVIEEIFKREAAIDARHVRVEVSDHTAKLYGHVHSLQEANAASAAAAAVRGISRVESHLVISSQRLPCTAGATLLELTGGRGPDKCIDAVGMEATHGSAHVHAQERVKQAVRSETDRPHVLRQAITRCRSGGVVSVIGVYDGFIDKFPAGSWMNRSLTLRTGQCHVQRYMKPLLQRIEHGEIDPTRVITHTLPLEQVPRGYDLFKNKEDNCEKVVLKPVNPDGHLS